MPKAYLGVVRCLWVVSAPIAQRCRYVHVKCCRTERGSGVRAPPALTLLVLKERFISIKSFDVDVYRGAQLRVEIPDLKITTKTNKARLIEQARASQWDPKKTKTKNNL